MRAFDEILDWDLAALETGVDAVAKRSAGAAEYGSAVRTSPAFHGWTGAASEQAGAFAGRHADHSDQIARHAKELLGPLRDYANGGKDLKGRAQQLAEQAAAHGCRIGPDGSVVDGAARTGLYGRNIKQRFAAQAKDLIDQDAVLHRRLADAIKTSYANDSRAGAETGAGAGPGDGADAGSGAGFDRSLHLAGATNARDIGGYQTSDGRAVRTGAVFRSNRLEDLTDADIAELKARGLRQVDDLRSPSEQAEAPDREIPGVRTASRPIFGDSYNSGGMTKLYTDFVSQPKERAQFAAVLRDIENSPGPILYHCTSGKDRTGWTTAVLLSALGVPRQTVEQDYMLSNDYLHQSPAAGSRDGVDSAWLDAAFAAADKQYGGMDGYVRQGLGLSDADVQALRAKLLV
ncbi:MAG: tyrosine-protein phosphatase [Segniliparus sp.]|uniref:tyrosine-protein phosphatase n=1 Tax=Segniliparus sp. TaxID=2804064 RepID=UPI003F38AC60